MIPPFQSYRRVQGVWSAPHSPTKGGSSQLTDPCSSRFPEGYTVSRGDCHARLAYYYLVLSDCLVSWF